MALGLLPYSNLQDLSTQQLWVIIAQKVACIAGCTTPPDIQDWNKKKIIEWTASTLPAIENSL